MLNVNKAEFVISAASRKDFIRDGRAQFVFAGRSNVGKSSLINKLLNRKNFARVGGTPGKTAHINYFRVDSVYFVDLPGYGYAKVPEKIKAQWGKMIENYLHTSKQLLRVFLLVDIRHEPSANDVQMYKWIVHQGFQPVIIATKSDKIKKSQHEKHLNMLRQTLGLPDEVRIFPYSALKKEGRDEIYEYMDELLAEQE